MFLQNTEGLFQYYIDVGAYTFPILGVPYFSTGTTVGDFYGPVPIAWAKIAPTDDFYIQGGKLPYMQFEDGNSPFLIDVRDLDRFIERHKTQNRS